MMEYIQNWSGGKDSTASIILEHLYGLPKSKIIMSGVMFDKKRSISGELPEHMEWVHSTAIPRFQNWGYEIEILRADKDYLDCFFHTVTRSKNPERNGKFNGFPIGGTCIIKRDVKTSPLKRYLKQFPVKKLTQYVGISFDEPLRLEGLEKRGQVSLLAKYGYTEKMCYDLCKKFGLLSPIYKFSQRGGCWFCPNQSCKSFARLKMHYPELWNELEKLSHAENLMLFPL